LRHWLEQRRPLHDMYFGRDYTDAIDATLKATAGVRCTAETPIDGAAKRLHAGQLGRGRWGRARSSPIRRAARLTIC
jgi:hypothetical protein